MMQLLTDISAETMTLHKEISFETEICRHFADNSWLYGPKLPMNGAGGAW